MPGRREKDVDYLALSARVRAMENRLLTQERLDRMIDARDPAEAAKVLAECGYGELAELTGGICPVIPRQRLFYQCFSVLPTTITPRSW